jgi:hypothetical protein
MALFEDVFEGGNIVTAVAVGAGAALLGPIVVPVLRPIAKSAIKAGLIAYDQGCATLAQLSEQAEDIVAEVRAEMAAAAQAAAHEASSQSSAG